MCASKGSVLNLKAERIIAIDGPVAVKKLVGCGSSCPAHDQFVICYGAVRCITAYVAAKIINGRTDGWSINY